MNVHHGFVRRKNGKVHKFDVAGAVNTGTATTVGARNGDCIDEYDFDGGTGGFIRKRR
ncbi:MAG TPA: hypothetical protein VG889_02450 [Rhizomicrobium sp.]|nr:hypothetical protein [Rhizomicrobium sp.]